MALLSEEQPEFIGYCRHCQATMVEIDGRIRTLHECTADGHQAERRKDFTKRRVFEDLTEGFN